MFPTNRANQVKFEQMLILLNINCSEEIPIEPVYEEEVLEKNFISTVFENYRKIASSLLESVSLREKVCDDEGLGLIYLTLYSNIFETEISDPRKKNAQISTAQHY